MTNLNVLLIVLGVTLGVIVALLVLLPLLKKKGVNTSEILNNATNITNSLDKVISVAQDLLPNNPALNVLTTIEKWAKIAAGNAQQLYHAGEITGDERATTAERIVLNVLAEMKISVDNNKKALIDAAIKNAVNDLGHNNPDIIKEIAPTETVNTVVVTPKIVYKAPDGTELKPVEATTPINASTDTNIPTADTTNVQDNTASTDTTQTVAQ